MATKHDQILRYIEKLPVGNKISVRSIAKNLGVSEGTAYRAIKDAENDGLVSTIERVGTIRIERKIKEHFETLSFGEVVKIIEGDVLGGEKGLDKILNKFVIGAMEKKAMLRYITPGALMIVGNREPVQKLALENGAAVLITGGFKTSNEIVELANQLEMPILRTTYDTFTVATMINKAMTDQLIKKDVMLVEDIYRASDETVALPSTATVADYRKMSDKTLHTRFPIINRNQRLVGIVAAKDVLGKNDSLNIERVMTKDPSSVKQYMSVASVGHMMIWDGLEVMPVVADDLTLEGIVSRQDVMKAMQLSQRQPQMADTLVDQIVGEIEQEELTEEQTLPDFTFKVTPLMTNSMGTIAFGVLSEIVANVSQRALTMHQRKNVMVEQVNLHYLKMIQIETQITVIPKILDLGRRSAKLDIEIMLDSTLVAKAIVVCQFLERV